MFSATIQKSVFGKIREDIRSQDNREDLWTYIADSWEKLDNRDLIENLYCSIPNGMRLVIEKRGHWTKYS